MSKRITALVFVLITVLSLLAAYSIYAWLYSVQANTTLKIFVPALFFAVSFLGFLLFFNIIKLYFFQKKGIRGYKLRGKITSNFLLSTLGFIVVFSALMLYLIFLIENTFIDRERSVADNLLANYQTVIAKDKLEYEKKLDRLAGFNPESFPVSFDIHGQKLDILRSGDSNIVSNLSLLKEVISQYYSSSGDRYFYPAELSNTHLVIMKYRDNFLADNLDPGLAKAFQTLRTNADTLYRLRILKNYIGPVSILSLFILAIPILAGVFFVSLFVARNITVPIEEIVDGTKIIASGNLDYKVRIHTHDEIGDLAYHFNSMATKLKSAYQQIKRMERLEAWQEMAKKMAHEVKNPLTPIKLSAERLLYAYEFKPKEFGEILVKTTSTIINESKRLENLVNEFSIFARLPNLRLEKANVIKTVREVIEFFQGAYPYFKIESQIPFDVCEIFYDASQLKQVIINIVNNAIESSGEDDKQVMIAVNKDDDRFTLSITNKGPVIPKEIRDKIFEPYFTTKPHGSGIGLAIAERIILEHNGNIWFDSGENGTTFFVELPVADRR